MASLKERLLEYYEKNETKVDIGFFLGGFLFDVVTLSDVDDPLSIAQQVVYLIVIAAILYYDFLNTHGFAKISSRMEKYWNYRQLAVHFLLGSLLSVYSLFFLKSASFFSSIVFVLLMLGIMVANELKSVQKSAVDLKVGLYVICVFLYDRARFAGVCRPSSFLTFVGTYGHTPIWSVSASSKTGSR